LEDREWVADGGDPGEEGCDVGLGDDPEWVETAERTEDDGEAEGADSEIVLSEGEEWIKQEYDHNGGYDIQETEGHHGYKSNQVWFVGWKVKSGSCCLEFCDDVV